MTLLTVKHILTEYLIFENEIKLRPSITYIGNSESTPTYCTIHGEIRP
jgi:hypothetical protein